MANNLIKPAWIAEIYNNPAYPNDQYTILIKHSIHGEYLSSNSLGMVYHGEAANSGIHLGKRISWKDLPLDVQTACVNDRH